MKTKNLSGFVRFVIMIAFAISTAMFTNTAFSQALETVNVERATVVITRQCELARMHNDSPNASAFGEALNVLNGVVSTLSVDARNRIAIARNNAQGANQIEEAQAFEAVLVKCGVPISGFTEIGKATVATTVATSQNGTFHSVGSVDRCDYMIKRGSRVGHVCSRSKAEHVHLGEFYFCPDEVCGKCGKSAQVHFWEEGNGFLCHIHTEEVVGMVRQTSLPAVVVVGKKESVLKLTTSAPIVVKETVVVVKPKIKEDTCKYKGRANPAVPKRDP